VCQDESLLDVRCEVHVSVGVDQRLPHLEVEGSIGIPVVAARAGEVQHQPYLPRLRRLEHRSHSRPGDRKDSAAVRRSKLLRAKAEFAERNAPAHAGVKRVGGRSGRRRGTHCSELRRGCTR
jgi:hypothetical protein